MTTSSNNHSAIQESAGLLLTFSMFALVEGTLRMVGQSKPSVDVDYLATENGNGDSIVPVGVLLVAGVGEVIFGMLGIYLSVYSLIFNYNNKQLTLAFLVIQAILGWFVFICFVIVSPIFAAMAAQGNDLLSQFEQRTLIIAGNMLGSVCFCYALQGGQFIMGLRLYTAQDGKQVTRPKNTFRAMIWSINMILAALSTLYVGILLQSKSFSSTTAPVGAPPHVVWRPWLSLITGLIMLAYGVLSVVVVKNGTLQQYMPNMFIATTTAMMINFSWTFGIVPGLAPPIPGAAQHLGLVLAMTILPVLHTTKVYQEDHQSSHIMLHEKSASDTDDDVETPKNELSHVELVA